jgi:hypothetical protein
MTTAVAAVDAADAADAELADPGVEAGKAVLRVGARRPCGDTPRVLLP